MVTVRAKKREAVKTADPVDIPKEEFHWCTVSLSEIIEKGKRLEASVFGINGRYAREVLEKCRWDKLSLVSDDGFTNMAYYPGRCKRIYSDSPKKAIGFLGSSEMLDCKPVPVKFLSTSQNDADKFRLEEKTILLSRSGTVGNVVYVNSTLSNYLVSEHAIRIICKKFPGYLYAYLRTNIGKTLVQSNIFGAVVDQIEPEHLDNVPIPNPPDIIKKQIDNLIVKSFELRDESNEFLNQAEQLLYEELELPPIEQLKPKYFDKQSKLRNYAVKLSALNNRLDGSYHVPIVDTILKKLKKTASEITTIGDSRISEDIILPGRFKRVYVEEGQGTVFFGGKQIFELDPSNKKYLSLVHHRERIQKELKLKENMVMITCSGTIGKVAIVPKHWEGWTANQHIVRIAPKSKDIAGYLYAFLNTPYGYELIRRFTYGTNVDEIDKNHTTAIQIPLLNDQSIQQQINDLVLQANKKRTQAYNKEQEAIKRMNDLVIYATE